MDLVDCRNSGPLVRQGSFTLGIERSAGRSLGFAVTQLNGPLDLNGISGFALNELPGTLRGLPALHRTADQTLGQDKIVLLHLTDVRVLVMASLEGSIRSFVPGSGPEKPSAVLQCTL